MDFYKAFDSVYNQLYLQTAFQLRTPSFLQKNGYEFFFLTSPLKSILRLCFQFYSGKVRYPSRMPLSMLLFIMTIKQLTRKILALTKLQRISLGKASLKGSDFTDDLNLVITHSSFFSTLLEILNHFFLFFNLKINHEKTTIIFNSPDLFSCF